MIKIAEDTWALVDDMTGWPIRVGDVRESNRGETYVVTGGRPPLSLASTGRIYVALGGAEPTTEFYPSVFGAKWVDLSNNENQQQLTSKYTLDGAHMMVDVGGGFAAALAQAFFKADLGNRRKLIDAFEQLFHKHAEMAQQFAAAEE